MKPRRLPRTMATLVCVAGLGFASTLPSVARAGSATGDRSTAEAAPTKTPIKHLVVIFQENVSFDHYFGTYPQAGQPPRRTGVYR